MWFALAILVALVAEYWPAVLAVALITAVAGALRRSYLHAIAELAAANAERLAIAARCDQQHQWVLQGNERGVWGEGTAVVRDYRKRLGG